MLIDYKEYAKSLRENAIKDKHGRIVCSPELWEQIITIIENIHVCKCDNTCKHDSKEC